MRRERLEFSSLQPCLDIPATPWNDNAAQSIASGARMIETLF
jgi:hypothetical protein